MYALQKVGKAGIVLKPEHLQAVRCVYEGRDVSLWLPTGFVNPSAMRFSLVLRPLPQSRFVRGAWTRGYYDAEPRTQAPPHAAALWEGSGYVPRE